MSPKPRAIEPENRPPKAFAEFHRTMGEGRFTPEYNNRLETMMMDSRTPTVERVNLWILRYAWGNWSQHCVVRFHGPDAGQKTCAQVLGIHKRDVSRAIAELEARGVVRCEKRRIFPVNPECPALVPEGDPDDGQDEDESTWQAYLAEVSTIRPDLLEAANQARQLAEAKRREAAEASRRARELDKVLLKGFKLWVRSKEKSQESETFTEPTKSQESETKSPGSQGLSGDPSLLLVIGSNKESSSSSEPLVEGPPQPTTTGGTPAPEGEADQVVWEALSRYGIPDRQQVDRFLEAVRTHAPDISPQELGEFIRGKGEMMGRHVRNPIQYVITAVTNILAGEGYQRHRKQREETEQLRRRQDEQQRLEVIELYRRSLEDPNERVFVLDLLRQEGALADMPELAQDVARWLGDPGGPPERKEAARAAGTGQDGGAQ